MIPRDPGELTAVWFNDRCQGLPEVTSISIDTDVTQGMMSRVVRVRPRYADQEADGPPALIVKLASENPAMRARPQNRLGAVKEVRFYRELKMRTEIPTPNCFCAEVDGDSGEFVLVLEAVAGVMRDLESGCSEMEAHMAVGALARLHAAWWEAPALAAIDFLPDAQIPDAAEAESRHGRWWPEFREIVGDDLPAEMLTFGDRLGAVFPHLMKCLALDGPRTLRHGDYSLPNLIFREGDGSVVAIDWQMLTRGKGAWDLAWFLGQSLTVEQRRAWEGDLIASYVASLVDRGVIGCGADDCVADYRTALAQRFGTLITSIVVLPFTAEQKAEIQRVQLARNVAAILDHGGVALLEV